jgi:hypothetical protein
MQDGRHENVLSNNHGEKRNRWNPTKWRQDWIKPDVVSAMHRTLDKGWMDKPELARGFDDMAVVMDRLATTGNGQVPAVAALAWNMLRGTTNRLTRRGY